MATISPNACTGWPAGAWSSSGRMVDSNSARSGTPPTRKRSSVSAASRITSLPGYHASDLPADPLKPASLRRNSMQCRGVAIAMARPPPGHAGLDPASGLLLGLRPDVPGEEFLDAGPEVDTVFHQIQAVAFVGVNNPFHLAVARRDGVPERLAMLEGHAPVLRPVREQE